MKVKIPVLGQIAQSIRGRDNGKLYAVTGIEGNLLLLADGKERKLASPKKKNLKHVRLLPQNVGEYGIKIPFNAAFDCDVAHLLKELGAKSS